MIGELEPGPDHRKVRDPSSRRPPQPKRVPEVLQSYYEDRQFSISCSTQEEALAVKREITSAVYHLNKWVVNPATGDKWDIRVRPWLSQHWRDDEGSEHTIIKYDKFSPPAEAKDVYWKVNFHVHDPKDQGFRTMSRSDVENAHKKSAKSRGVVIKRPGRRSARTVDVRGE